MNKIISPGYLAEQRTLHETSYGSSGHYWLGHVLELCEVFKLGSVLDYGAGKATLGNYLKGYGINYRAYDPVTYPDRPKGQFDLVVCLDVLEHVEEAYLPAVFEDFRSMTAKVLFANVCTRPSSKTLSDGRNAHITQHDYDWWKPHFLTGFYGIRTRQHHDGFDITLSRDPAPPGVKPVSRRQIEILRGHLHV